VASRAATSSGVLVGAQHDGSIGALGVTRELVEREGHQDLTPYEADEPGLNSPVTALYLVELRSKSGAPPSRGWPTSWSCSTPLRSTAGDDLLAAVRAHAPDKETRHPCSDIATRTPSGGLRSRHHRHHRRRRASDRGPRARATRSRATLWPASRTPLARAHALAHDALAPEPRAAGLVDGRHLFTATTTTRPGCTPSTRAPSTPPRVSSLSRQRLRLAADLAFFPVTNEVRREALELDVTKIVLAARRSGAGRRASAARCDRRPQEALNHASPKRASAPDPRDIHQPPPAHPQPRDVAATPGSRREIFAARGLAEDHVHARANRPSGRPPPVPARPHPLCGRSPRAALICPKGQVYSRDRARPRDRPRGRDRAARHGPSDILPARRTQVIAALSPSRLSVL
jgi:hypothetical protein